MSFEYTKVGLNINKKYVKYIKNEEKKILSSLDILIAINNGDDVDDDLVILNLQRIFLRILNYYFIFKGKEHRTNNYIMNLLFQYNFLSEFLGRPFSEYCKESDFSNLIVRLYSHFSFFCNKYSKNKKQYSVNIVSDRQKITKNKYSKLFIWLKKKLSLYEYYIDYFIVHGSLADNTFIEGWSDLDSFVVLNDKLFASPKILFEFKQYILKLSLACYKVDILAHHRFYFITSNNLLTYSQTILPLDALKHSHIMTLIARKTSIDFWITFLDDSALAVNIFFDKVNYFRSKTLKEEKVSNIYQLKDVLSQLMLVPSLFCNCINEWPYKRESFKYMFKYLDDKNLKDVVLRLSNIRSSWKLNNFYSHYPFLFISSLPYFFNHLIYILIRKNTNLFYSRFFNHLLYKNWYKDGLIITDVMLKEIIKHCDNEL